ncbi:pilus assembly protein CpaC [Ectothiorhodosinus mongolicus]|uniref:Pilus assembly protein CpaC n=1 Tax=Ectothiorhodosinus mongolicus TaxID=233100 RepID=A0A1R3VM14_9GAMM|nr:type II and III secretion system protein family protein [Ectothiorhodosinus mongolicus]ULX57767.1 pilus assembly protein CpaC [Ectothiorhodosinus mongolicus]SIT65630.1 pilus assembly protein CpaC [Ectothiorhodosinus mongolicus]
MFKFTVFLSGWVLMLGLWVPSAHAQNPQGLDLGEPMDVGELVLAAGKSRIVTAPVNLTQVVVGNPDVADVRMLSSRRVLLVANRSGRTNLAFRGADNQMVAMLDLVVTHDIDGIKRKLHELLPDERDLQVRSSNSMVILSGQVSDTYAMDTALAAARSFAGDNDVRNLLQVGGGQQVMLEVRIAEVKRNSLKALGISTTITGSSGSRTAEISTGLPLSVTPFVDGLFTWPDLLLRLEALETRGLAKTLAEPNIVALSGQEGSFLAGGEFPVPVLQSGGSDAITVEFKEYGVGLLFTPMVLSSSKINLRLQTEVSTIDFENATSVAGTSVPALNTRRTGTTIELADGQSFVIAGLLQENMNNVLNQVPGLGSVPILGALFRSTEFRRNETELAIVVRARLVAPSTADVRLPTDNIIAPSDIDQYLLGTLEHREISPASNTTGGLEGSFGHEL